MWLRREGLAHGSCHAGIGEKGPSHGVSTSGQEKQTFVLRNGYGLILKRIVIEDYFSAP
jgi:hypothetical protein